MQFRPIDGWDHIPFPPVPLQRLASADSGVSLAPSAAFFSLREVSSRTTELGLAGHRFQKPPLDPPNPSECGLSPLFPHHCRFLWQWQGCSRANWLRSLLTHSPVSPWEAQVFQWSHDMMVQHATSVDFWRLLVLYEPTWLNGSVILSQVGTPDPSSDPRHLLNHPCLRFRNQSLFSAILSLSTTLLISMCNINAYFQRDGCW